LIELAQQKNCVLQVGHVERFNPVFKVLQTASPPNRVSSSATGLSPYPARSTDIGVVLDLMIHDLDVVLAFVKSPVTSVDAVGIPVLSKSEDIANVRLRFANGCVANLTASRISPERMRKIRVFQRSHESLLHLAGLPRAGGFITASPAMARKKVRC
jgi:predicted dehydrogenase